ncbi:MAG: hypothetical protein LBR73_02225 [Oscillospiraceae bacterium]|jgi:hypothetical protein|nr:hypothetical protein [Oscillospiraceae bacterium]
MKETLLAFGATDLASGDGRVVLALKPQPFFRTTDPLTGTGNQAKPAPMQQVTYAMAAPGGADVKPITLGVYLQTKYGQSYVQVAAAFEGKLEKLRAVRLPDGGCAVLDPAESDLHLFRPDGTRGATLSLHYKGSPAADIAFEREWLWFTCPKENALVQFSVRERAFVLRAGGHGIFPNAQGLCSIGGLLYVCCGAKGEGFLRIFNPVDMDLEDTLLLSAPPVKYARCGDGSFAWIQNAVYALKPDT